MKKTFCSIPDELLERSELAKVAVQLFDEPCRGHDFRNPGAVNDERFLSDMHKAVREKGEYFQNRLPMALAKDMYTLVVIYRTSRFFRFVVKTYLNFNRSK